MAIYAKMKMDKIPKSCMSCLLSERKGGYRRCIVTGTSHSIGGGRVSRGPAIRPEDCPLIKVEEE